MKNKKPMLFAILGIFLLFVLVPFSITDTTEDSDIINDAELGQVTIYTQTQSVYENTDNSAKALVNKIITSMTAFWKSIAFAIQIDPTNPSVGETAYINMGGSIPSSCYPSDVAFEIRSNVGYSFVKSLGKKGDAGSSWTTRMVFTPSKEGQYTVKYIVYGKSNIIGGNTIICDQDTKTFTVSDTVKDCPKDYCSNWKLVNKITGGELLDQSCYEYGSAPLCKESITYETLVSCNDGYKKSGSKCVKIEETQTTTTIPSNSETTTTTPTSTTITLTTGTTLPSEEVVNNCQFYEKYVMGECSITTEYMYGGIAGLVFIVLIIGLLMFKPKRGKRR